MQLPIDGSCRFFRHCNSGAGISRRLFATCIDAILFIYPLEKFIFHRPLIRRYPLILSTILFSFFMLTSLSTSASECDSFTHRFDPLPDMTEFLNQKVNDFLEKAVKDANLEIKRNATLQAGVQPGPEPLSSRRKTEILYNHIRMQLGRPLIGQMESLVNNLPNDESRKIPFEESIYRDFRFIETPTLASLKAMGAIIEINGHTISADKFGHFFSEGWSYFSLAYSDTIHIETALFFGEMSESIFFGALTTGVYSYADLAANFNGMRFWNRVLGLNPDVLNPLYKPAPYIQYSDNKFIIMNQFDWREYIDASWDEGINCNSFRNDHLLNKVTTRIHQLNQQGNGDCTCPVENTDIAGLKKKYGKYSVNILNLTGNTVLSEDLQPQILFKKYWDSKFQNSVPKWEMDLYALIEEHLKELQETEYYKKLFQHRPKIQE